MKKKNSEKSGALKTKNKNKLLREEVASAPGQLKISNILSKATDQVIGEKRISDDFVNGVYNNDSILEAHAINEKRISKDFENGDSSNSGKNDSFINENENELSKTSYISEFAEAQSNIDDVSSLAEIISDEESLQSNSLEPLSDSNGTVNPVKENPSLSSKISIAWLTATYDCLVLEKRKVNNVSRPFMFCQTCKDFGVIAAKKSRNGVIQMAAGIRVDSQVKIRRVMTHLEGIPHKEADLTKTNKELWNTGSEAHQWRKIMNSQNQQLIKSLIRMAVDVFNDSLHDTLPAWNWSSRSLAMDRSQQIIDIIDEKGFDAYLPTFKPPVLTLRYKNPSGYNEMLEIVADLEKEKTINKINDSICYSVQIDGSLDKSQRDNKFVTVRYLESDCTLHCAFLSIVEPKQNGAKGLLEAVKTALGTKLNIEKLVSITTDGESANTGRLGGLWHLLENDLKRKLLTIWCTCHRSDLALEDLEHLIPEVKYWKLDVIACSTFFRTSKCNTKQLNDFAKTLEIKTLAFPSYSDVRFAQHLETLLNAVLRNLPVCRKVWISIINSRETTTKQKSKASDLLELWAHDSLQFKLSALMSDVVHIFTVLQKGLQKSNIMLPDVLTLRDSAVRKFNVIIGGPMPGGKEGTALQNNQRNKITIRSHLPQNNAKEKYSEIRLKITEFARDFTAKRLNIEADRSVDLMKNILTANDCASLIKSSVKALTFFINKDEAGKLAILTHEICEQWPLLQNVPTIDTSDIGCKYSERLRKMFVPATGLFKWLLGIFIVSSPHSMGTERVVSHYVRIKSIHRQSAIQENLSNRLTISLNCNGTADFDPRSAVLSFMKKKDRRDKPADSELYETHDFVKKFFRKDSNV